MIVAAVVMALTFGAAYLVLERRFAYDPGRRIAPYVRARRAPRQEAQEAKVERPYARTERHLRRLPGWRRFETLVERARPGEPPARLFWFLVAATAALALCALALGASAVVVGLLIVVSPVLVRLWLALRISGRRRAFDDQLPELLGELASALRAGHGFNQALAAVASDAAEPASTEFGRVLTETRLGRPLEDALTDLGQRIGSADLDFVIDAVVVQRQVGGSLASIFDVVGEAVRQRHQYALRLRSLTATGRISAIVLLCLPAAIGVVLWLMNHAYFAPLEHSATGRLLIGGAVVMLGVGSVWLRQVVSYDGASR
jgi:tight adherence protein B